MSNFPQESSNDCFSHMSDAYKFLFNKSRPTAARSENLTEYNKLLMSKERDTFVDASLYNWKIPKVTHFDRRVSTDTDGYSAYNFSFQEEANLEKSEFCQDKEEMVLGKTEYLKDVFDDELLEKQPEDHKDEMNIWPDYQKNSDPWIVLEHKDEDFFQKECSLENFFNNVSDESLEFETFAVPECCHSSGEKIDEWAWQFSDKTEDKESVKAKEAPAKVVEKERRKKRKTKTNAFALGRTWFRGMSNYFKDKFEPTLKQWEKDSANPDRLPMDQVILNFITSEFETMDALVNTSEFLDSMVTILHSQNYKKDESFIRSRDFKRIRALLYCYSSNAKKNFVADKNYALIFQHFFKNAREEFLSIKAKDKYPEFKDELRQELEDIYILSLNTLRKTQ